MSQLESLELVGLNNRLHTGGITIKKELFYDVNKNNVILFTVYGEGELEDIPNSTMEEQYKYLINDLNTKENLIVDWSYTEGTTSDYIIYYGIDPEYIEETFCPETLGAYLDELRKNSNGYDSYKYLEYKDEKFNKLFK